jgi:predicted lipoprotein
MNVRRTHGSYLLILLSVWCHAAVISCQESGAGMAGSAGVGGGTIAPPTEAQQALLVSLTKNVYRPTVNEFSAAAHELEQAVSKWGETPTPMALDEARQAWSRANLIWQKAEVMQIGPAGSSTRRVAGADIRESIYSFPTRNPCRVDQELVTQGYEEIDWVQSALSNVQGLDAIEYLLYSVHETNQCPDAVAINRDGTWDELLTDPDTLSARRRDMTMTLASRVVFHADALVMVWAEGSEFTEGFITGKAPFSGVRDALNESYAGLFYLDKVAKDLKLGKLTELSHGCSTDICPEALESRFAHLSKENLKANLVGFRAVYFGGYDGPIYGFDRLLRSEGAEALADSMAQKIEAAITAVDAIDSPLYEQLENSPETVRNAYEKVKILADLFKGHFVTILNLDVPQEGAGDAD